MKFFNRLLKVVTALAAVAGAIYVLATYGDKIVAWAKKVVVSIPDCPCCHPQTDVSDFSEETEEEAPTEAPVTAEHAAAEAAPVEEAPAVAAPVEEAPQTVIPPTDPVADDKDFEA